MDDANPLNCKMMWSTISKVICGLSVFIGGFIAFFGHRYFQSQQFFFGAYAAGLVSFVVMSCSFKVRLEQSASSSPMSNSVRRNFQCPVGHAFQCTSDGTHMRIISISCWNLPLVIAGVLQHVVGP